MPLCSSRDDDGKLLQTKEILNNLGVNNVNLTIDDCRNVRRICDVVSKRAAYLAAAGIKLISNILQHFALIFYACDIGVPV